MSDNISQPVTRHQCKEEDTIVSGTEAAEKIQRYRKVSHWSGTKVVLRNTQYKAQKEVLESLKLPLPQI